MARMRSRKEWVEELAVTIHLISSRPSLGGGGGGGNPFGGGGGSSRGRRQMRG
ncbi:hypothetical protein Syun_020894 [Stephania yunnanensis]|uniref:Uncharacterized protein n=1 Tax=Stephania yunnanensis TaxID=152371 RepID=A0AAP0NNN3_9MAGN